MAQDTFTTPTITASGTTWTQYKAGGLAAVLANLITANAAKTNPDTQATAAGSVAVGTLPAGTYYFSYTFVDAFGETTVGTSESAQFTGTGLAQLCTVTLPANPTGCHGKNLYVTPTDGASGSEVLYASGITGTTFACNVTFPAKQSAVSGVPAANTTGAENHTQRINSLAVQGATEGTLKRLSEDLSGYLSGAGIPRQEILRRHMAWTGITKLWYTALNEIMTLIVANMPTAVSTSTTAIGFPVNKWTLP